MGSIRRRSAVLVAFVTLLDGSLHYTKYSVSAGGVGRNICEALEKLDSSPVLLSAVGDDDHGKYLRSLLQPTSTKTIEVIPGMSSAQCTVVLDSNGECKLLLGEMDMHKQITPDLIRAQRELLKRSPLIVTDGNLPVETLACVLEIAQNYGKPVFYEPTDVPVAANPFKCKNFKSLKYISPNINELRKIAECFGFMLPEKCSDPLTEASTIGKLVAEHVDTIFVTLGSLGLMVIRRASAKDPLFSNTITPNTTDIQMRHYTTTEIKQLVNVSGAGDCLASGIIYAMLAGYSEEVCISVGFAAAQMALQSQNPVPSILFDKTHSVWSKAAAYDQF